MQKWRRTGRRRQEMDLDESAFSLSSAFEKNLQGKRGEFEILVGCPVMISSSEKDICRFGNGSRLPLKQKKTPKDFLEDDRYSQLSKRLRRCSIWKAVRSISFCWEAFDHENLLDYFDPEHQRGSIVCIV